MCRAISRRKLMAHNSHDAVMIGVTCNTVHGDDIIATNRRLRLVKVPPLIDGRSISRGRYVEFTSDSLPRCYLREGTRPEFMFRVNRGDFVYTNCRSVVLCAQLDASV